MNKILIDKDQFIALKKDSELTIKNDSVLTLVIEENVDLVFNIEKVKTDIYVYAIDKSLSVTINANKEKSICNFYYSNINYDDNKYQINVYHKAPKSEVNLYNHGVNVENNKLLYDVTSKVPKDNKECITNQDNRIINIKDGKSTIRPILLIDNYDISSSHAAYIGKFDDDVMFYLTSRGISVAKAYELLLKGFLVHTDPEEITEFMNELSKI
ncbi:MAG: SufD family Fe-S cluster assembly protein [Bacilli bacterium]|nr:SufD family Fe-S cluster assembly protein [Bacilli bacterium]